MGLVIFLLIAVLLSTSNAESDVFNPIRLPRPRSATSGEGLDCLSWRLLVETNNRQNWKVVPQSCKDYIKEYMEKEKGQYHRDCKEMAEAAIAYAKDFTLAADGKDIWVFDIDETTLSNLDYYARPDVQYGTLPRNSKTFYEWLEKGGISKAVPGMLNLYDTVLDLGFKTVFLTASSNKSRELREENLKKVGYDNWMRLIFREEGEGGPFKSRKRTELVEEGYRIIGNVGDQWSDLLGPNAGIRTFKVPNPMYYTPLPRQ